MTKSFYEFKDILSEVFENTRKSISTAILKQSTLPPTYPSLGPVMFFLKDSKTGCLHNWSRTKWNELKLGWMLKEIISPILDLINDTMDEIFIKLHNDVAELSTISTTKAFNKIYLNEKTLKFIVKKKQVLLHYKGANNELLDVYEYLFNVKNELKNIKAKHVYEFDNFWDTARIHEICESILKMKDELPTLFEKLEKLVDNEIKWSGIRFSLTRINKERAINLIKNLVDITKGRNNALLKFKGVINEPSNKFSMCTINNCGQCPECPPICRYIFKHPRLKSNPDQLNIVRANWNKLVLSIISPRSAKLTEEEETELIVDMFDFMPQEIQSSKVLRSLEKRLKTEVLNRKDWEVIELSDISILKSLKYMRAEIEDLYELYKYTQIAETLFYGGLSNDDKIVIEHAFVVPIRFFNSQVKGQIVILSPDKIAKSDCLNAVNQYYNEIRTGARLDFYTSIMEEVSSLNEHKKFSYILTTNLPKLFNLQGVLTWEKSLVVCGVLCKDLKIVNGKLNNLTFEDGRKVIEHKVLNIDHERMLILNDRIKNIIGNVNLFVHWDVRTDYYSYKLFDFNNEEAADFNVFDYSKIMNDGEIIINSCLLICYHVKGYEPITLLLFFNEDFEQIQISCREMAETIFYGLIFKYTAELAIKYAATSNISAKDHDLTSEIQFADLIITNEFEFLKSKNYNVMNTALQVSIEDKIKLSYDLISEIISTKNRESHLAQTISIMELLKLQSPVLKKICSYANINLTIVCPIEINNIKISVSTYHFGHIFRNLIRNSEKAFNENHVGSKDIIISFIDKSQELIIEYSDNAGGIDYVKNPKLNRDNIFLSDIAGKGLKQILSSVESLSGEIEYINQVGIGLKYKIALPIVNVE